MLQLLPVARTYSQQEYGAKFRERIGMRTNLEILISFCLIVTTHIMQSADESVSVSARATRLDDVSRWPTTCVSEAAVAPTKTDQLPEGQPELGTKNQPPHRGLTTALISFTLNSSQQLSSRQLSLALLTIALGSSQQLSLRTGPQSALPTSCREPQQANYLCRQPTQYGWRSTLHRPPRPPAPHPALIGRWVGSN